MTPELLELKPRISEIETETRSNAVLQRYPDLPEDPTRTQVLRLIERSGALSFWDRAEEDGYTENDGEPT